MKSYTREQILEAINSLCIHEASRSEFWNKLDAPEPEKSFVEKLVTLFCNGAKLEASQLIEEMVDRKIEEKALTRIRTLERMNRIVRTNND